MKWTLLFLTLFFSLSSLLYGQGRPYEGPEDPAGDKAAEREGYMTGNRVFLYFQNTTELAKWVNGVGPPLWSRWPNNNDGVRMLDGIALLIGARVYIDTVTVKGSNGLDSVISIPVTDMTEIQSRNDLDTLYYLQTSYREEMDTNPLGTIEYGLYPVFGYFNRGNEYPAMSNIPGSWPPDGWPASGYTTQWPGEWDGRFGRGQIKSDLETYFVANDAQDQEYLGLDDLVSYRPRPNHFIDEDNTLQPGKPWGGIGIRVAQRGFQWNNPQARDAIFWEYSIANISDYDLPEVAFGYWVDNGIGGESDDELGFFNRTIDLAYSWDKDELGRGGLTTGTMGFAYLESPGIPYDNEDNDEDGLVNEKRNNLAGSPIGPTDGIADLDHFLSFYNLKLEDLKDHYEGDEDQDWQDGNDANGNNAYAYFDENTNEWIAESGESANDDVGTDGVGPFELNYDGPDANGSEGNHQPDYDSFIGKSEPNFATTDVSESDMIGLTSFQLFPIQSHSSSYRWFRGDKSMWELIGENTTEEFLGTISNLVETFASGPFPLYQSQEERISMSELHSYDNLAGLNSDEHLAPALFEQKRIVQVIYEADYRFAQPPRMPTLTATPGDGKVTLTWDNISDTKTRDPFVGNVNDFEGYKLYRATDKRFSDSEVITDGYGNPFTKKPIFQCDIIDGIKGFTDFGLVNGASYNLGVDNGIVHHFIDEDVQNGRTYYYALVAYDYGAPDIGPGIAPSENTIIVDLDEQESIRTLGQNVAVVIPRPTSAGYKEPAIDDVESFSISVGTVTPEILANNALKYEHTYKVKFGIDTLDAVNNTNNGLIYTPNSIYVYDVTAGGPLVYSETPEAFSFNNIQSIEQVELGELDTLKYSRLNPLSEINTDVFDGIRLTIDTGIEFAEYDYANSGWQTGSTPINIVPAIPEISFFPWDYNIVFTNNDSAYVSKTNPRRIRDESNVSIERADLIRQIPFSFYVENRTFADATGHYEKMELLVHDVNNNNQFDILEDRILVGALNNLGEYAGTIFSMDFNAASDISQLPVADDVYKITYRRPFWASDSIMFKVQAQPQVNTENIADTMAKIKVVPNPYIATNTLEEAVSNPFLNQRRRIMFTHVPAKCTIKIFTVSGLLVDRIDVDNTTDNGIAYWDLLTSEGLEVAAGIYIFHLKAEQTGDVKLGKFAIVK